MSKIKNVGLDQYGAGPFEQQQFGTAGVEGVNADSSWLYAVCVQDGSIQQRLSADATALGNVSSYAGSEAGDAMASAQGMVNYQLPNEQASYMWKSQQPAVTNAYAPQTSLGWCGKVLCCFVTQCSVSAEFCVLLFLDYMLSNVSG